MVGVVTDSAASLPPELAEELGIEVVPIYLTLAGRTIRDDHGTSRVYEELRRGSDAPRTATPSPGDFVQAFERTGGPEVVCVTVASSLSGIHQAATVAARHSTRRVQVVDSGNASMAQGFVAMEAARAARAGADLRDVAGRAAITASRARLVATIPTLEYLRRSGRMNRWLSYLATAVGIRPVFRLSQGRIESRGRPRTRSRAVEQVLEEMERDAAGRPVHVAAVHAAAPDEAARLLDRAAARLEVVESHVAEFSAAMGAHTGPGLVGLAWFAEDR
jgi:DegV family protein with EDD domain